MRALADGAIVAGIVIGWYITHTVRDWLDWRGSIDRMKANRSVFFGRLPRALVAGAIGLLVLRVLF